MDAEVTWRLSTPPLPEELAGPGSALGDDWGKLRTVLRAVVRRPRPRVPIGPPVQPGDLRMGRVGDADPARYRFAAALTRGVVPLRAGAEHRPHYPDATRPTTAVAAYPGGVVPEHVP